MTTERKDWIDRLIGWLMPFMSAHLRQFYATIRRLRHVVHEVDTYLAAAHKFGTLLGPTHMAARDVVADIAILHTVLERHSDELAGWQTHWPDDCDPADMIEALNSMGMEMHAAIKELNSVGTGNIIDPPFWQRFTPRYIGVQFNRFAMTIGFIPKRPNEFAFKVKPKMSLFDIEAANEALKVAQQEVITRKSHGEACKMMSYNVGRFCALLAADVSAIIQMPIMSEHADKMKIMVDEMNRDTSTMHDTHLTLMKSLRPFGGVLAVGASVSDPEFNDITVRHMHALKDALSRHIIHSDELDELGDGAQAFRSMIEGAANWQEWLDNKDPELDRTLLDIAQSGAAGIAHFMDTEFEDNDAED